MCAERSSEWFGCNTVVFGTDLVQLAFEFFVEIQNSPRQLYPELSVQLFDEYILHVMSLVQLLDHNAKNNSECVQRSVLSRCYVDFNRFGFILLPCRFYRLNRTTLFDRIHALATDHVRHLREIVQVRALSNELTAQLDASDATLQSLATARPQAIGAQRNAPLAKPSAGQFFGDLYACIGRVTSAARQRQQSVSVRDIFPIAGSDAIAEDGKTVVEAKAEKEKEEEGNGNGAADTAIYYSTNMSWVWAEDDD